MITTRSDNEKLHMLAHIRYEIESLLVSPNHPHEMTEIILFWQLAHARVLGDFFSTKKPFPTDVKCDSFGFPSTPNLLGPDTETHIKKLNKQLFHLTWDRLSFDKDPTLKAWRVEILLPNVKAKSKEFLNYVVSGKLPFPLDKKEEENWRCLADRIAAGGPYEQNSPNVAQAINQSMSF